MGSWNTGGQSVTVSSSQPSVTPEGSIWYDTSNDLLKSSDGSTFNQVGKTSFASAAVVSQSTTIGDYTTPVLGLASSANYQTDDFTSYASQADADIIYVPNDSAKMRVNITNDNLDFTVVGDNTNDSISRNLAYFSNTAMRARFTLRFSTITQGAGGGTMFVGFSSGNQTIASNAAQDFIGIVFAPWASYASCDADAAVLPTAGDNTVSLVFATATDYFFEIERTSATNYIIRRYSSSAYTTVSDSAAGTCAATVTGTQYFVIRNYIDSITGTSIGTIDNLQVQAGDTLTDNSTSTAWTSISEVNPNNYVDMSSALNLCAVAFYWDGTGTTSTEITIQTSIDALTWTTKRTVTTSGLTNAAWNYYRFNIAGGARYLRIYGTDVTAKILSLFEIKVLTKTDAQIIADLGLLEISTTSTSLTAAGT